ncbi:beta-propeller fold lactonase family protein [Pseudomonas fluorescens]|uniref:YVTN family beta-propeller repeat protein n=1 Tax=Pseudomonas fluorescens TaxID=294 RepID=UPI001CD63DDB|nr:YncE family protein [Pseudomonas fluorescens]
MLYPVIIPGWVSPVKPADIAHGGIPKALYDGQAQGLECLVDPWTELQLRSWIMAVDDRVDLYCNGDLVPGAGQTVKPGEETLRQRLYLPHEQLRHGANLLQYEVTRVGGNSERSRDLRVLYHLRPVDSLDLVIPADVLKDGVSAARAAQGVEFGFTYANRRNHDRIEFLLGDTQVRFDVPDGTAAITHTLFTDTFQKAGDNPSAVAEFYVVDQLGNRVKSPEKRLDIHLDRVELEQAILREIPTENNDDPAIVDLAKLNGGPLWALIHLIDTIWKVGDEIHLTFTSLVNGSPVATHEQTLPITQVPGQFSWDIPNSKVIADSVVRVIYEQVRSGVVIATSRTATAQVTGEAVEHDVLTFTNEPYTIAPAGRLKNVELLLSTRNNTPVPGGKLSLTLPANFMYADGSSGQRDFITDAAGRVSVSRIKGTLITGSYSLSATSGAQVANATVTVTERGPVGSIPVTSSYGIAVSPDGTRVYVGNDRVSVIDTATNQVLTHIPVGSGSVGIAFSPDGTRAYASNQAIHRVCVIDTTTNEVVTNIPANTPTGIAVSPDGSRIYVSNYGSHTVSVIDTATHQVLTIPVGNNPWGVAISPDGTRTYVCGRNSRRVSVIDTATNRVLTNIPANVPVGVAVSPDGTRVYVSNQGSHTVSVIDTATNQVLTNILVGNNPYGIAVSQDGSRAYVSNYDSDTVSVIDTATNQVLTNIPAGSNPLWIAISPDGTRAYVCNFTSHTVSVIGV